MESSGTKISPEQLMKVDLSPEEMRKIAMEEFATAGGYDEDEADESQTALSEESWKQAEDALKNKYEKSVSDLEDAFKTFVVMPSGSLPQMSQNLMERSKKALEDKLTSNISNEDQAAQIVELWMKAQKKFLTVQAQRALASAILINPGISAEHFDLVILGWEIRGDQNVVEAKNVMDAHQDLLNTVLASQREFQSASKGLLTGIQDLATKLASAIDKLIQIGSKFSPTRIISTPPPPVSIPTKGASSSGMRKIGDIPILGKPMVPALKPVIIELERTPENFLKLMGLDASKFERFIPGDHVNTFLTRFLDAVSPDVWRELNAGKNKHELSISLSQEVVEEKKKFEVV